MTLWGHLCCIGYGIEARAVALWHLARGHRLHWRDHSELWIGYTGDIWCEACPDSSDGQRDVSIWYRHWYWMLLVGEIVCGWLGHPGFHDYIDGTTGRPVGGIQFCDRCSHRRQAKQITEGV